MTTETKCVLCGKPLVEDNEIKTCPECIAIIESEFNGGRGVIN